MSNNKESCKARYDFLKANNICVICGQRKAMDGRVRCAECSDRHKRQTQQIMMDNPERRQHERDRSKHYYHYLKEKGLCTCCGKEKATHGIYCDACYWRIRKQRLFKQLEV